MMAGNPVVQLLAQMQAVENLRAQNAAAAQSLAAQLHNLSAAQKQARELAAQKRAQDIALAAAAASAPSASASTSSSAPIRRALEAAVSGRNSSPSRRTESKPEPPPPAEEEDEVPRCHLHRKMNKACKFCKAHCESQEQKTKKLEERRNAAIEKLRERRSSTLGSSYGPEDKAPLPNLIHFPQVLLERIQKNDFYNVTIANAGMPEVKQLLFSCETCDTESRAHSSLDLEPSAFICSVYRLLNLQLTEGQLQALMNSRSCWIRCAGFMYIRLGVHQDRYWELLSDALMDDEEFVPFPGRGAENMSVGQYVEQLLAKDKYCNLNLPRIPVAQRRTISKRLVLYGQFRRRYAANLEVMERFKEPGTQVEVCTPDGEWSTAETIGTQNFREGKRLTAVNVKLDDGSEQAVSIGMLIVPGKSSSGMQDLTRSRGRSAQELLERYQEQQRDNAVASGKDYCKTSGQHTVRVGGVVFVAGVKRKELEMEHALEDDKAFQEMLSGPSAEHRAKMAAIESKYCARSAPVQAKPEATDNVEGPERLRLG
uniref:Pre-mRNA-splicing factor 38 n=1 Tax=Alexandrium monilatum TaxID=311494 RepID=A0A7S4W8Z7_9DINO